MELPKVTLLVFAVNELIGMKEIMPRIDSDWVDQIIVVDGGSTDGTYTWAEEQGYQVIRQSRPGLRHAYNEALLETEGEIVITFSPDGNSIPEIIPDLISTMNQGYDMVVCSRYLEDAKSYDDDIITRFGNWFLTSVINIFHKGELTDAIVMFRAWKRHIYTELDIDSDAPYVVYENFFNTNLGIEPLLAVRALKRKLKIFEIPGDEPVRIGGERKLEILKWGLSYFLQIVRELWYWK